jgi:hypothetical protein
MAHFVGAAAHYFPGYRVKKSAVRNRAFSPGYFFLPKPKMLSTF